MCYFCAIAVEIEARDACYWLLAAGFPQYVQLYEGASRIRLSALVITASNSIFSCKQVKRAANITSVQNKLVASVGSRLLVVDPRCVDNSLF